MRTIGDFLRTYSANDKTVYTPADFVKTLEANPHYSCWIFYGDMSWSFQDDRDIRSYDKVTLGFKVVAGVLSASDYIKDLMQ
jgi:hypothetical protein